VYRFQEVHELIHKPQGIQQKMCERNASAMYMSIRKFAVTSVARWVPLEFGRGERVNNPPLVRAPTRHSGELESWLCRIDPIFRKGALEVLTRRVGLFIAPVFNSPASAISLTLHWFIALRISQTRISHEHSQRCLLAVRKPPRAFRNRHALELVISIACLAPL
jgi:hypothetical protein